MGKELPTRRTPTLAHGLQHTYQWSVVPRQVGLADKGASPVDRAHQAAGLQVGQRLPDRDPADAMCAAQLGLRRQALTCCQFAAEYRCPQRVANLSEKRFVDACF